MYIPLANKNPAQKLAECCLEQIMDVRRCLNSLESHMRECMRDGADVIGVCSQPHAAELVTLSANLAADIVIWTTQKG